MNTSTANALDHTATAEAWEYLNIQLKLGDLAKSNYDQTMNRAGADGWELVSALSLATGGGWHDPSITNAVLLLFKRRRR